MYQCFIGCTVSDKHEAPVFQTWNDGLGLLKCVEDSTFCFLEHIIIHIYQNPPVGSELWAPPPKKKTTQKQKQTAKRELGAEIWHPKTGGSVGSIENHIKSIDGRNPAPPGMLIFFSYEKYRSLSMWTGAWFLLSYVEMWHPTAVITDHARWPMTGVLSLSAWCCHWFHQTLSSTEWRRLAQFFSGGDLLETYIHPKSHPLFFHSFGGVAV